jgi:hypothetical protein
MLPENNFGNDSHSRVLQTLLSIGSLEVMVRADPYGVLTVLQEEVATGGMFVLEQEVKMLEQFIMEVETCNVFQLCLLSRGCVRKDLVISLCVMCGLVKHVGKAAQDSFQEEGFFDQFRNNFQSLNATPAKRKQVMNDLSCNYRVSALVVEKVLQQMYHHPFSGGDDFDVVVEVQDLYDIHQDADEVAVYSVFCKRWGDDQDWQPMKLGCKKD